MCDYSLNWHKARDVDSLNEQPDDSEQGRRVRLLICGAGHCSRRGCVPYFEPAWPDTLKNFALGAVGKGERPSSRDHEEAW